MTHPSSRRSESVVYLVLWCIVVAFYLIDRVRFRVLDGLPAWDFSLLVACGRALAPFLVFFFINNYLLIPRLLLRSRLWAYFGTVALLLAGLWAYLFVDFGLHIGGGPEMESEMMKHAQHGHPHVKPLLPMPLFMDITYALLEVGVNMAVSLLFRHFDDKLQRETMMKAAVESRLDNLRAQINPHFYMNMLNNIHGMIDIDASRAQSMLLDMSHLMRYMLYESSQASLPLSAEVAFLRDYISLMRQRFPADLVEISESYPEPTEMAGIEIAPLLFLVFVENAFKHGISYRHPSHVSLAIGVEEGRVVFRCANSRRIEEAAASGASGIGLENVGRRLGLLYGGEANLSISDSAEGEYVVNLSVPLTFEHETTDSSH